MRRSNLVRMFEATGQIAATGPVSPEQEMLRDLKRALSEQLAIFSEKSPNVVALRNRIATLQEGCRRPRPSVEVNAGPSELDLQLSDIDEGLGFIAREKAAIAQYVTQLGTSIDATPANETKLNALERNRDNIRCSTTPRREARRSVDGRADRDPIEGWTLPGRGARSAAAGSHQSGPQADRGRRHGDRSGARHGPGRPARTGEPVDPAAGRTDRPAAETAARHRSLHHPPR